MMKKLLALAVLPAFMLMAGCGTPTVEDVVDEQKDVVADLQDGAQDVAADLQDVASDVVDTAGEVQGDVEDLQNTVDAVLDANGVEVNSQEVVLDNGATVDATVVTVDPTAAQ